MSNSLHQYHVIANADDMVHASTFQSGSCATYSGFGESTTPVFLDIPFRLTGLDSNDDPPDVASYATGGAYNIYGRCNCFAWPQNDGLCECEWWKRWQDAGKQRSVGTSGSTGCWLPQRVPSQSNDVTEVTANSQHEIIAGQLTRTLATEKDMSATNFDDTGVLVGRRQSACHVTDQPTVTPVSGDLPLQQCPNRYPHGFETRESNRQRYMGSNSESMSSSCQWQAASYYRRRPGTIDGFAAARAIDSTDYLHVGNIALGSVPTSTIKNCRSAVEATMPPEPVFQYGDENSNHQHLSGSGNGWMTSSNANGGVDYLPHSSQSTSSQRLADVVNRTAPASTTSPAINGSSPTASKASWQNRAPKTVAQSRKSCRFLPFPTNQRPFICDSCNSRFRSRCELKRHRIVHTGERPYLCTLCGFAFTQSGNLLRHLRSRHPAVVGEKMIRNG